MSLFRSLIATYGPTRVYSLVIAALLLMIAVAILLVWIFGPGGGIQRTQTLNNGALSVEVPSGWSSNSFDWSLDNTTGPAIVASPDLDSYTSYSASGAAFTASEQLFQNYTLDETLDLDDLDYSENCSYQGREDWPAEENTGNYITDGRVDRYIDCAGTSSTLDVYVGVPDDNTSTTVVLLILIVDPTGSETKDTILSTFDACNNC